MKKIIRIGFIVGFFALVAGLLIYNSLHPARPDMSTWNTAMTMGDPETAKYHFIMYTDISCPYCSKFSDAVMNHEQEFKEKYIDGEGIYFEVRLTDINYMNGHSVNSKPAAEANYCAAKQNKFWEYYHGILSQLYTDYHSKGVGVSRESKMIPELGSSYYLDVAKEIEGLDQEQFKTCFENHETLAEIEKNTQSIQGKYGGVPFFIFGKKTFSGFAGKFDDDFDWHQVELMMKAGIEESK